MPLNRVLIGGCWRTASDVNCDDEPMTARRPPGLAAVLANSGYRRLFIAQTISRWGDIASTMALVVLTGSGLKVSGVVIAEILPVLLLAPVAGTVADRLPVSA